MYVFATTVWEDKEVEYFEQIRGKGQQTYLKQFLL